MPGTIKMTKTYETAPSPSICFIIPYFGRWPFWFPLFLESCRHNNDINWLIYSDCGMPINTPDNVRIVATEFSTYCDRVSRTLGISFSPASPYKLCDLKPALGLIHEADLKNFDFWAFGDLDVIYGNIRRHFSADRLARHDLFVTHERRVSGHCCLFRNTTLMREAFTNVRNWRELLANPQHQWFDESAFSRLFIRRKNWPDALRRIAKPFNRWTRIIDSQEAFSTPNARVRWTDGTHNFPAEWTWHRGHLTNSKDGGREFPYLHFVAWKKWWGENDMTLPSVASMQDLAATDCWHMSREQGFFRCEHDHRSVSIGHQTDKH